MLKYYPDHFLDFLWFLNRPAWFDLLAQPLLKPIVETSEDDSIKNSVIAKLRTWINEQPREVIAFWNKSLHDNAPIVNAIIFAFNKFEHWKEKEEKT